MSEPESAFPPTLEVKPLARPPRATVRVPGSKSITNRALVLAALSGRGCELRGALRSEDTEVMIEALRALGFSAQTDWPQSVVSLRPTAGGRIIPAHEANLFVANSGTSLRFLTALVATGQGTFRLDGTPRMRQRPCVRSSGGPRAFRPRCVRSRPAATGPRSNGGWRRVSPGSGASSPCRASSTSAAAGGSEARRHCWAPCSASSPFSRFALDGSSRLTGCAPTAGRLTALRRCCRMPAPQRSTWSGPWTAYEPPPPKATPTPP